MVEGLREVQSVGYIIDGFMQAIQLIISLNPEVIRTTTLSLEVSGIAVLLSACVGIPVGVLIALNEFPFKRTLTIINTLMGLPPVVAGLFVFLMISHAGPLGTFKLLFTPTAMVIAQFILVTPIIIGLSISAANAVDRSVIEYRYLSRGEETRDHDARGK